MLILRELREFWWGSGRFLKMKTGNLVTIARKYLKPFKRLFE